MTRCGTQRNGATTGMMDGIVPSPSPSLGECAFPAISVTPMQQHLVPTVDLQEISLHPTQPLALSPTMDTLELMDAESPMDPRIDVRTASSQDPLASNPRLDFIQASLQLGAHAYSDGCRASLRDVGASPIDVVSECDVSNTSRHGHNHNLLTSGNDLFSEIRSEFSNGRCLARTPGSFSCTISESQNVEVDAAAKSDAQICCSRIAVSSTDVGGAICGSLFEIVARTTLNSYPTDSFRMDPSFPGTRVASNVRLKQFQLYVEKLLPSTASQKMSPTSPSASPARSILIAHFARELIHGFMAVAKSTVSLTLLQRAMRGYTGQTENYWKARICFASVDEAERDLDFESEACSENTAIALAVVSALRFSGKLSPLELADLISPYQYSEEPSIKVDKEDRCTTTGNRGTSYEVSLPVEEPGCGSDISAQDRCERSSAKRDATSLVAPVGPTKRMKAPSLASSDDSYQTRCSSRASTSSESSSSVHDRGRRRRNADELTGLCALAYDVTLQVEKQPDSPKDVPRNLCLYQFLVFLLRIQAGVSCIPRNRLVDRYSHRIIDAFLGQSHHRCKLVKRATKLCKRSNCHKIRRCRCRTILLHFRRRRGTTENEAELGVNISKCEVDEGYSKLLKEGYRLADILPPRSSGESSTSRNSGLHASHDLPSPESCRSRDNGAIEVLADFAGSSKTIEPIPHRKTYNGETPSLPNPVSSGSIETAPCQNTELIPEDIFSTDVDQIFVGCGLVHLQNNREFAELVQIAKKVHAFPNEKLQAQLRKNADVKLKNSTFLRLTLYVRHLSRLQNLPYPELLVHAPSMLAAFLIASHPYAEYFQEKQPEDSQWLFCILFRCSRNGGVCKMKRRGATLPVAITRLFLAVNGTYIHSQYAILPLYCALRRALNSTPNTILPERVTSEASLAVSESTNPTTAPMENIDAASSGLSAVQEVSSCRLPTSGSAAGTTIDSSRCPTVSISAPSTTAQNESTTAAQADPDPRNSSSEILPLLEHLTNWIKECARTTPDELPESYKNLGCFRFMLLLDRLLWTELWKSPDDFVARMGPFILDTLVGMISTKSVKVALAVRPSGSGASWVVRVDFKEGRLESNQTHSAHSVFLGEVDASVDVAKQRLLKKGFATSQDWKVGILFSRVHTLRLPKRTTQLLNSLRAACKASRMVSSVKSTKNSLLSALACYLCSNETGSNEPISPEDRINQSGRQLLYAFRQQHRSFCPSIRVPSNPPVIRCSVGKDRSHFVRLELPASGPEETSYAFQSSDAKAVNAVRMVLLEAWASYKCLADVTQSRSSNDCAPSGSSRNTLASEKEASSSQSGILISASPELHLYSPLPRYSACSDVCLRNVRSGPGIGGNDADVSNSSTNSLGSSCVEADAQGGEGAYVAIQADMMENSAHLTNERTSEVPDKSVEAIRSTDFVGSLVAASYDSDVPEVELIENDGVKDDVVDLTVEVTVGGDHPQEDRTIALNGEDGVGTVVGRNSGGSSDVLTASECSAVAQDVVCNFHNHQAFTQACTGRSPLSCGSLYLNQFRMYMRRLALLKPHLSRTELIQANMAVIIESFRHAVSGSIHFLVYPKVNPDCSTGCNEGGEDAWTGALWFYNVKGHHDSTAGSYFEVHGSDKEVVQFQLIMRALGVKDQSSTEALESGRDFVISVRGGTRMGWRMMHPRCLGVILAASSDSPPDGNHAGASCLTPGAYRNPLYVSFLSYIALIDSCFPLCQNRFTLFQKWGRHILATYLQDREPRGLVQSCCSPTGGFGSTTQYFEFQVVFPSTVEDAGAAMSLMGVGKSREAAITDLLLKTNRLATAWRAWSISVGRT